MKFEMFYLLLLAGVVSVAQGEMTCLQNQITACASKLQIESTGLSTSCEKLEELDQCVKEAFKDCKEEDAEDFAALMQALKDMCNQDSDLHEKFANSSECLLGTYFTGLSESPCIQEVKTLTENLKEPTLEKITEFSKKLCAAVPKLLECVYEEVEDICSKDARDVVSALGQPVSSVMSKNCAITDKVDIPSGSDSSALSWFLVAAATLLVVVWH